MESTPADAAAPPADVPAVARGQDPTPAPDRQPPATAAVEDAVAGGWRSWRSWPRSAAVAAASLAVVLVAVVFGIYRWHVAHDDPTQPAAAPTLSAQVEKVVDELGYGNALKVSEADAAGDGRAVVQGYLDTENQRRDLLSALQPFVGNVDIRVWSTALLEQSVTQALDGLRLQLDVSGTKDGKVVLAGVLPASMTEDRLKEELLRDVPGIASIDLEVISLAAAARWLQGQIAGIGLSEDALSIAHDDHSFVVSGRLDTGLQSKWQDLVKAFGQRYGHQLTLRDNVTFGPAAVTTATFNFSVRAINLGPPAYVMLDTNAKYLVGSRFDNGMILEEVLANGMVLRDGANRHLIEIAQDSGEITDVRKLESD